MIAEAPVEVSEVTTAEDAVKRAVANPEINAIEAELAKFEQVRLPLNHIHTPGLYVREVFIPKGTLCTTKIHKTEHPFVISKGAALVWSQETGVLRFDAPYTGVTKPGTRRVIFAIDDVIWSTFHPTEETDLAKIEAQLIEPHDFPFIISPDGYAQLKGLCECTQ